MNQVFLPTDTKKLGGETESKEGASRETDGFTISHRSGFHPRETARKFRSKLCRIGDPGVQVYFLLGLKSTAIVSYFAHLG